MPDESAPESLEIEAVARERYDAFSCNHKLRKKRYAHGMHNTKHSNTNFHIDRLDAITLRQMDVDVVWPMVYEIVSFTTNMELTMRRTTNLIISVHLIRITFECNFRSRQGTYLF